jgi:DNA-binding transcriptional LysR family regulator
VADELANGSLVPVLPDAWDEPLPVQAVYGSRSSGNPAVAALLSTLREGLREPLGRGALPEAPGG